MFESEEPGRHPPVAVRRTLLIEACYKCAICRENGPIEFHHVMEWTTVSHHAPQHMLAVCSNCHARITRLGEPDVLAQRQIKKNLQERQAASEPTPEFVDPAPPLPNPAPTLPQESDFANSLQCVRRWAGMTNPAMLRLDTAPLSNLLPHTESITMLGPSNEDTEKAKERAEKNGTTLYEELESDGYTTNEIKDAFQDYIDSDPDLRAFLNERDSSCTNEELGLDEEGNIDD